MFRPLAPGAVKTWNEQFTVEYTYNPNAIEGNVLTLWETDLVLRGFAVDKKPLKDHLDVVGHKERLTLSSNLCRTRNPSPNGLSSRFTSWFWGEVFRTAAYIAVSQSISPTPRLRRPSLC